MKKNNQLFWGFAILLLVFTCFVYYMHQSVSPSSLVLANNWMRGFPPHLEAFKEVSESNVDQNEVGKYAKELMSIGVVRAQSDAQLLQVMQADDKALLIYIYARRSVFGATYYFVVDAAKKVVVQRYYSPDS